MRSTLFVLILHLWFFTEGVSQEKVETPILNSPDSSYIEDIEEEESDEPYVNPYQQAQDNYQKETINRNDFNTNSWQKAKEGLDYTLEPEKKDTTTRKKNSNNSINPVVANAILTAVKWFFIIGAVVILAYLVLRFVGEGNIFGRQNRRIFAPSVTIDLEHIEENLEHAELDPYIKKAIEQKQFSVAIRLYYLAILKELTLKEAIVWKKDKTNRTYVHEMREHPLFQTFRNQTRIFERVWYGNSILDEAAFTQLQPAFQDLLAKTKI